MEWRMQMLRIMCKQNIGWFYPKSMDETIKRLTILCILSNEYCIWTTENARRRNKRFNWKKPQPSGEYLENWFHLNSPIQPVLSARLFCCLTAMNYELSLTIFFFFFDWHKYTYSWAHYISTRTHTQFRCATFNQIFS